eukprot:CAMPEP_0183293232 /NCGR_PEP_ID=MMETSP0160_2-20130417/1996_1 /TAXON_ID=2839 ORGANISM="Odontella Sinensis, Strain Grunow 1884" /NCGR_SAMPLE_ID=MMETSP0160_2 /ASSEMBLY_ACC=CAM_ASM_000250 /LENGTH=192 /DNA_ID=CAMNT_0025454315 /DNA_START=59 /DNA_END=640 /DNA_ORIENTATION=-
MKIQIVSLLLSSTPFFVHGNINIHNSEAYDKTLLDVSGSDNQDHKNKERHLHSYHGGAVDQGGVETCKYENVQFEYLLPGDFLECGEGICAGGWTFGLTKGKCKLQLLFDGDVKWTAGVEGIGHCSMNTGGAFACYQGSRHNPKTTKFALNCGGYDGSYMYLDSSNDKVLQKLDDNKSWAVKQNGKVKGSCA